MSYQIVLKTLLQREKWNGFVDANSSCWLWHLYDLHETICTWNNRIDLSFGVERIDDKKIVALFPLHATRATILRFFDYYNLECFGGIAFSDSLSETELHHIRSIISLELQKIFARYRSTSMLFTHYPLAPSPDFSIVDKFPYDYHKVSSSYIIDLTQDEDTIIANYSTLTRRELRKAEQNKYEILEVSDKELLQNYYTIHCETFRRTGVHPHPYSYFSKIFDNFISKGLARLILITYQGTPVAGNLTAIYKGGAYYWSGGSITDKSGGENRLAMHNQILHAKQRGCTRFDVGQSFPFEKSGKLMGLNSFKRSFGGEVRPFFKGILQNHSVAGKALLVYLQLRTIEGGIL